MEAQELREELITYIQLADEKKLEALHTLLIGEQNEEADYRWWKDEAFVKEMEEDVRKIESGEERGYTEEEVYAEIDKRLKQRKAEHV